MKLRKVKTGVEGWLIESNKPFKLGDPWVETLAHKRAYRRKAKKRLNSPLARVMDRLVDYKWRDE